MLCYIQKDCFIAFCLKYKVCHWADCCMSVYTINYLLIFFTLLIIIEIIYNIKFFYASIMPDNIYYKFVICSTWNKWVIFVN